MTNNHVTIRYLYNNAIKFYTYNIEELKEEKDQKAKDSVNKSYKNLELLDAVIPNYDLICNEIVRIVREHQTKIIKTMRKNDYSIITKFNISPQKMAGWNDQISFENFWTIVAQLFAPNTDYVYNKETQKYFQQMLESDLKDKFHRIEFLSIQDKCILVQLHINMKI